MRDVLHIQRVVLRPLVNEHLIAAINPSHVAIDHGAKAIRVEQDTN